MQFIQSLNVDGLVFLALALNVAGFVARDELLLRGLLLGGSASSSSYYLVIAGGPLWEPAMTNSIVASINLIMILVLVSERTTLGMSAEHLALYRRFPLLNPGQFRRLRMKARWVEAADTTTLIEEGTHPTCIYFAIRGKVEIEKGGQVSQIDAGKFLGELAFLTGEPASATVRVPAGAHYLVWENEMLHRLLARNRGLKMAFIANFNIDLAHKVAMSQPRSVSPTKSPA